MKHNIGTSKVILFVNSRVTTEPALLNTEYPLHGTSTICGVYEADLMRIIALVTFLMGCYFLAADEVKTY